VNSISQVGSTRPATANNMSTRIPRVHTLSWNTNWPILMAEGPAHRAPPHRRNYINNRVIKELALRRDLPSRLVCKGIVLRCSWPSRRYQLPLKSYVNKERRGSMADEDSTSGRVIQSGASTPRRPPPPPAALQDSAHVRARLVLDPDASAL
jgi:hypothetical protein